MVSRRLVQHASSRLAAAAPLRVGLHHRGMRAGIETGQRHPGRGEQLMKGQGQFFKLVLVEAPHGDARLVAHDDQQVTRRRKAAKAGNRPGSKTQKRRVDVVRYVLDKGAVLVDEHGTERSLPGLLSWRCEHQPNGLRGARIASPRLARSRAWHGCRRLAIFEPGIGRTSTLHHLSVSLPLLVARFRAIRMPEALSNDVQRSADRTAWVSG